MYDICSSHIRRGFSVLLVQALRGMLEPWVAGRVTGTDSRAISFYTNSPNGVAGHQKTYFMMKHFFRFLCVMAMLCYSMSGHCETVSMWVGDSYTITEPSYVVSGTMYYQVQQCIFEYDAAYFSLTQNGNQATVKLKAPFQGTKAVTCKATYTMYGTKTYTHYFTCNPVNISLYPTVMTLDVGQSQTMQWQFSPSNTQYGATVSFSSSDSNVASVDFNGKVTALSAGNATITATTNYGTTATCEVTVNPALATSISLNQSTLNIAVGGSQTLIATVLPEYTSNKTVIWQSSNTNVATVNDNGEVTGMSPGTVSITATTTDGSNLSASCSVTVTSIAATTVIIDKIQAELSVGQSIKLTATVLPAGAQQRVTWSSSDPSVARVVGGTVYAQAMGECLITARTLDGTNLTADCLIMVYPEGEVPTPTGLTGDMNGDGKISIADVTALIDYLLSGNGSNNSGSNEGALDGLIW